MILTAVLPAVLASCAVQKASMSSQGETASAAERVSAVSAASAVSRSKTYASPDGHLAFRYPATWFLEDHWIGGADSISFLTNFKLGTRCCDMLPTDLKVDFGSMRRSPGDTFESLLKRESLDGPNHDVTSTRIESIEGVRWAFISADDDAEGSFVDLAAFAVKGDRVYRAVAFVPDGPLQRSGIAQVEEIYRSFIIR